MLNDLGADHDEPLRLDGMIGPKTEGAFRTLARTTPAETVTRRYGEMLGFLS